MFYLENEVQTASHNSANPYNWMNFNLSRNQNLITVQHTFQHTFQYDFQLIAKIQFESQPTIRDDKQFHPQLSSKNNAENNPNVNELWHSYYHSSLLSIVQSFGSLSILVKSSIYKRWWTLNTLNVPLKGFESKTLNWYED